MAEDPRVTRSRSAVVAATLELLGEGGVAATTIDEIADRSGVAKTTIYRHWDSVGAVVLDAVATQLGAVSEPDTGDVRTDLYSLVGGFAAALAEGPLSRLFPALIDAAEHDREFAALHARFAAGRHAAVRHVLERGIERGELPDGIDLDLAIGLLAGPLLYQRLITHQDPRPTARDVVDVVLRALQPAD